MISWLGSIGNLTPYADFSENPYERLGKPGEPASPFPVPSERRSYSQNCVVWIKPSGLQVFRWGLNNNNLIHTKNCLTFLDMRTNYKTLIITNILYLFQTEIQKVLRHARKLPEKLGPFYEVEYK